MKFLVRLKPLEPFFFGQESKFGALGDDKRGGYFAKSGKFPQQTTILGMIKRELLIATGHLKRGLYRENIYYKEENSFENLIGKTEFDLFEDYNISHGNIKELSEVFLYKENKENKKGESYFLIKDFFDKDGGFDNKIKSLKPFLINFNPKNGVALKLFSSDFKESFKLDNIFQEVTQVGIKKVVIRGKEVEDNQDGFFKKSSYILKQEPFEEPFEFAFNIEIDLDLKELIKRDRVVFLGGERGKFLMRIDEVKNFSRDELEIPDKKVNEKDTLSYVVLLSDSYIKKPLKELCDFAITSEVTFRYLKNDFKGKNIKFKESGLRYLYEKGSIFINPKEEFFEEIKSYSNLRAIGFNQYKSNREVKGELK